MIKSQNCHVEHRVVESAKCNHKIQLYGLTISRKEHRHSQTYSDAESALQKALESVGKDCRPMPRKFS